MQRDAHQLLRLQALRPQRRALPGPPPRQQQRARRVLAKMTRERRAPRELGDERVFDILGLGQQQLVAGQRVAVGEPQRDAVVGPQRMDGVAELGLEPARDHQRPRRVYAAAERRQDAHARIAELVAKALDRDRVVAGNRAGVRALVLEVAGEVVGSVRVEPVVAAQPRARRGGVGGEPRVEIRAERAERAAELDRPARAFAAPERHLAGLARRRAHDHAVARDVLDAPGRGAEQERLALAALGDHLLVELADARAVADVHGERAAIRNRAARQHAEQPRALARDEHVGLPIPRQPRAQLRERIGRIAAGEHVDDANQDRARQLAIRRRARDHRREVVDAPRLDRDHRDDLLREHVERAVGHADVLDVAVEHAARDDGSFEQVAAELRQDAAAARAADVVARAADALQPARHRARRLELHDEIDGPHIDAELERAGRGDRAQVAGLERFFDLHARVARDRAVMRAHELGVSRLPGQLGQRLRDALREPPRVDEDDRRAMREHQLEQLRVDRGPHAAAALAALSGRQIDRWLAAQRIRRWTSRPPRGSRPRGRCGHLHLRGRHDDLEIERGSRAGVDDLDAPVPAQISSHFAKWTLRGG